MILKRGQRIWVVLNHQWPDQEEHQQPALSLETGAYGITIEFHQPAPDLGHCGEAVHAFDTGFQVKYRGPDTECGWAALPLVLAMSSTRYEYVLLAIEERRSR